MDKVLINGKEYDVVDKPSTTKNISNKEEYLRFTLAAYHRDEIIEFLNKEVTVNEHKGIIEAVEYNALVEWYPNRVCVLVKLNG